MSISAQDVKTLRDQTSCGIMDCRNALEEAQGDINKAKELLRKRGLEMAEKKASRAANEGRLEVYIHPGNKLAVLVEVNCETDFVSKSDDFIDFTKGLAMHIAWNDPKYIAKEEVPEEELSAQKDADEYYKQACLLEQAFVKDQSKTIQDMLNDLVAKIGENIKVGRFSRIKIGEE